MLFLLFASIHFTLLQEDSSSIYARFLTDGNSKNWYSRPIIIDNPAKFNHYTTLTFKFKPRVGSIVRPRGRDLIGSFRNFSSWKVQKQDDKYILIIYPDEKYFISFIGDERDVLDIEALPNNHKHGLSVSGLFFKTPLAKIK